MTSYPPASCCTAGIKHEGTPTGKIINIYDVESYIAEPTGTTTKGAVLVLPDVIGHNFTNIQLLADQLAANGYFAVVPDLFQGDAMPLNHPADFDFMKWLVPAHLPENVDPVIESTIKYIREEKGIKNIGGAGYCFGAKYVIRFLKEGKLDAGFVAHPSLVEPDELMAIQRPLSIAAAETDTVFPPAKRHESEEILLHLKPFPYQITLYSNTTHGFAVRGDVSIKEVKFAKEQAFFQAVAWFEEYVA